MSEYWAKLLVEMKNPWETLGYLGQLVFASRFFVQWVASEKAKASVIPLAFWYLSIVGSIMMLWYAIVMKRPALIMGYGFNVPIYVRNLWLIYGWGKKAPANA